MNKKTKKTLKPRAIIAIVLVLAAATIAALFIFTDTFDNLFQKQELPQDSLQGILLDKDTKEETAYSLEILKLAQIESEYIKGWIDRNKGQEEADGKKIYYTLYDDNPNTPLEMYLFMPAAKEVIGDITLANIKVKASTTAIILHIDTTNGIQRSKESTDLILHIYGTGSKATAKTERLVVNEVTYTCLSSTFTRLK